MVVAVDSSVAGELVEGLVSDCRVEDKEGRLAAALGAFVAIRGRLQQGT